MLVIFKLPQHADHNIWQGILGEHTEKPLTLEVARKCVSRVFNLFRLQKFKMFGTTGNVGPDFKCKTVMFVKTCVVSFQLS